MEYKKRLKAEFTFVQDRLKAKIEGNQYDPEDYMSLLDVALSRKDLVMTLGPETWHDIWQACQAIKTIQPEGTGAWNAKYFQEVIYHIEKAKRSL